MFRTMLMCMKSATGNYVAYNFITIQLVNSILLLISYYAEPPEGYMPEYAQIKN